jgi:hypothetical protein
LAGDLNVQPPRPPTPAPRHRVASRLLRARLLASRQLAACLLVAGLTAVARAAPLADPTQPPPGSGTDTRPAPLRNGRAPAPAARAVAAPVPLPVLQSVWVPTSGLAMAMIDGQMVKAGDTVGGRLVQAIDRQGITLAGSSGPERVQLLGGSPKQPAGSIVTMHAAHYEPAATDASDAPASTNRPGLAMPSPTTPVPLSVAGRTAP